MASIPDARQKGDSRVSIHPAQTLTVSIGLQAIQNASDAPEQTRLQKEFESFWGRRLQRAQKWDKAFAVLHQELQAMFTHLQLFYDISAQHVDHVDV